MCKTLSSIYWWWYHPSYSEYSVQPPPPIPKNILPEHSSSYCSLPFFICYYYDMLNTQLRRLVDRGGVLGPLRDPALFPITPYGGFWWVRWKNVRLLLSSDPPWYPRIFLVTIIIFSTLVGGGGCRLHWLL